MERRRVEAAAKRAIEIGARSYGSVKSIRDTKARSEARAIAPRGNGSDPAPAPISAAPVTTIEENASVLHPALDQ